VGTITTGDLLSHSFKNASISEWLSILLWIRIASAPPNLYASALFMASTCPHPAINASTQATTEKSGSI